MRDLVRVDIAGHVNAEGVGQRVLAIGGDANSIALDAGVFRAAGNE